MDSETYEEKYKKLKEKYDKLRDAQTYFIRQPEIFMVSIRKV